MFGFFKKERTRIVATMLSRMESHVVVLVRATLDELEHNTGAQSAGKVAASERRDLIPGAPLSNLGQLTFSGTPAQLLDSLDAIVSKIEQVKGSKAGLTAEAQQLVDDHFSNLHDVRQAISGVKSAIVGEDTDASRVALHSLKEACDALDSTAQKTAAFAR